MRLGLALLLVGVALAGCMEDDRDDDGASSASVAYSGSGSSDRSDTASCDDGAGQIAGGGVIDSGSLRVTVTDASGQPVFERTYDDAVELEGENLEGTGGGWTVRAQGAGGFDGEYAFTVACT